jgi:SAM-dependent methyltransferase
MKPELVRALDVQGGSTAAPRLPHPSRKDRSQFQAVLTKCIERYRIGTDATVLVIGGMQEDADLLRRCGFKRMTLSNIEGVGDGDLPVLALDAENIRLPDDAYDMVVAHEVLHHCRSPHRALCEMLRVARRNVIMMDPNDSAFMRALCRLRFSFPFEIAAVVDNDYVCGGVRNSPIPNFIYRWNAHEIQKVASSFLAECEFHLYADPYWDFNVEARDLAERQQTRIGMITSLIGPRNFIKALRFAQTILNQLPILRRQGNKFFCCIQKNAGLRPWLVMDADGQIVFNQSFQKPLE